MNQAVRDKIRAAAARVREMEAVAETVKLEVAEYQAQFEEKYGREMYSNLESSELDDHFVMREVKRRGLDQLLSREYVYGNCPKLMAERDVRVAYRELVNAAKSVTGLSADRLYRSTPSKWKEAHELLMKLAGSI